MEPPAARSFALGVLDQLPFMRTYTQLLLCFPIEPQVDRLKVIGALQHAAAALIEAIPILGGQVVNQKDERIEVPDSGSLLVVPYNHPNGSSVRVKALDEFVPYHALRSSKVPASMLDATTIAPMKGLPERYGDSDVTPVLIIQANFIPGGLLLCFAGMHSCMDATGLGGLIRMFATLCRDEQLSGEDLEAANFDRAHLPVSLKPDQSPMSHPELAVQAEVGQSDDSSSSPASVWSYFNIPTSKLRELKADGSKGTTSGWVSTNDVVSAWLWQAITKARSSHIDTSRGTTLLRAINARRVLKPPFPGSYLGNIVMCAFHQVPVTDIRDQPLSKITQEVRKVTNTIDDHYVRSVAALIRAEPDRNKIGFVMDAPDRDFLVSSWAALPVYEDFGVVGKPEYVRRPTFSPWAGVCYIMPKQPDGSFEFVLSLQEDDMLRLRNDEHFAAVAEYIG
ncbi:MAG: hypothetical protein LQ338_004336 [Usnochroma carphineum]|nr:MAG: hypothetical protein LQ338_004336 [Usnochroma carphineum]